MLETKGVFSFIISSKSLNPTGKCSKNSIQVTVEEATEMTAEEIAVETEASVAPKCSAPHVQTVEMAAKCLSNLQTENPFTVDLVFKTCKTKRNPLLALLEKASMHPALKNTAAMTTNVFSTLNAACAEWTAKSLSNPCQVAPFIAQLV